MSAFIPHIKDYKPFFIQTDTGSGKVCHDTTEWGLVARTNPYPVLPKPKEPYRNDWAGADGDDEYTAQMHYEGFEMQVGFYVKCFATSTQSATEVLRSQLDSFFSEVRQGEFEVFDSYTKCGFRKVRYGGYGDEEFMARDDWARLCFTVTLKVNDPVSRMKLVSSENEEGETYNQIVEAS